MSEKRVVHYRLAVLAEVSAKDTERFAQSEFGVADQIGIQLADALNRTLGLTDDDSNLGWQSMKMMVLDEATMNCGRCSVCGTWVTDREKPEPIDGLQIGATVEGRLLCDEHLPERHRWAF